MVISGMLLEMQFLCSLLIHQVQLRMLARFHLPLPNLKMLRRIWSVPVHPDTAAATETFKRTTEAYMPVLEAQRSFGKSKREENSESEKNAE